MIKNGKSMKLSQQGNLPDVSAAITGWFSAINFVHVQKRDINGMINETPIAIKTMGVIQPLSPQEVAIKPEGQRTWKWLMIHCLHDVSLKPDDVIEINCEKYRVLGIFDYSRDGYMEYHCAQDYRELTCEN